MPALGLAQETGKLVRWLKRDGEQVAKGEPLMEVETDKATVEVESPATGTLAAITAVEGDDIKVGHPIATILAPGESAPAPRAVSSGRSPASPEGAAARGGARRGPREGGGKRTGRCDPGGRHPSGRRSRATGRESPLWRAMSDNVTRSWKQAPHFFIFREVDASALVEARRLESRAGDLHRPPLCRGVAAALVKHPRMNSDAKEVNIGLAVAVPDGLIVPVIHGVDGLSVEEIATRRHEVVERVRAGRLRSADVTGGTFTFSNLGMYGVDLFTAILTEGQAGILAVGRIADRVVAQDGAAVVRPTMLMSLSCDHRRVDGARAAEFMQTLVELIEKSAS